MRAHRSLRAVAAGALALSACALLSSCATQAARQEHDPIERVNRKIFWFNDKADTYVLVPVAKGWNFVMPHWYQLAIARFFSNLDVPADAVNNLLQAKPKRAVSDFGRFALNSTIGLLGLFDPATGWGMPKHDEDVGQTLGYWGVPPGPYVVIPLLGPSNVRDVFGRIGDVGLAVIGLFVDAYILIPLNALDIVNTRSLYLDEVEAAKKAALDYYIFVRDAYRQRREAFIRDARDEPGADVDEDLYYFDDEDHGVGADTEKPRGGEPDAGTRDHP